MDIIKLFIDWSSSIMEFIIFTITLVEHFRKRK